MFGNKHASGEEIIKDCGEDHLKVDARYLYTSADSVLQIAAHEEVFGLDRLYKTCKIAAEIFSDLRVQRIIARPFLGEKKMNFSEQKIERTLYYPSYRHIM